LWCPLLSVYAVHAVLHLYADERCKSLPKRLARTRAVRPFGTRPLISR